MKKFDLNKAKKGAELVTVEGKPAKLIYTDRISPGFPLIALIDERNAVYYTKEGKFYADKDSKKDLKLK